MISLGGRWTLVSAVIGAFLAGSAQDAGRATLPDACRLAPALEMAVQFKFPGVAVVSMRDLDPYYRAMFAADHKGACPGVAEGRYWGRSERTGFALALRDPARKDAVRLVVARRSRTGWHLLELEPPDEGPAPVVWKEPPGRYHDRYNDVKRRTKNDVIMFVGYESWARAYIWNGTVFEALQISD